MCRVALFVGMIGGLVSPAAAQFLRLGIFDLAAETSLKAIYTTNVEGQRESEATEEMKDFYIVPSLSLSGNAPFGRSTQLTLDTSFGMEKHFVRTDLDSESAPFGRLRLDSRTELGRYSLGLYGGLERALEEREDRFVPGGRKKRDPTDTLEYGGELRWEWRNLKLSGKPDFTAERHREEEFRDGDQDELSMAFDAAIQLRQDLSAKYSYEQTRTEILNDPDDNPEWDTTESITLDWNLPLWERPTITYSLGVERETKDGVSGDWELTHRLSMTGDWEIFPAAGALRLSLNASYQYEKDPEEDDITFTYGADLEHEISRTARQRLSAKREPVETFGSKNDTDSTTLDYTFTKQDLFIYNLQLMLGVSWSRDAPMEEGAVVEKTLEYTVGLTHSRDLSRKLARDLAYEYSLEDSNLEAEMLQEHRVTLTLTYTF
ncbi:MAG: hypothetical protein KJ726_09670 [Verrucomicrobia bacterium]|nr:hypothetical protein [Verrucomicrobiota bacterium]MBU1910303.1 hypothetical protein [Verrucomicrobiota bacterium]